MSILFTLGLNQQDKPERWASKHKVYRDLSVSLEKLGITTLFLCNPASIKPKLIQNKEHFYLEGDKSISKLINEYDVTHIFIWGGRSEGDLKLRESIPSYVNVIYSEAGWFPQSGHCYFSQHGTNASARLSEEGLEKHVFNACRYKINRFFIAKSMLGFFSALRLPSSHGNRCFDVKKPIFIPLQDERDTNITISSPVKTMSEFLTSICTTYPDVEFIARPHPRATYSFLPKFKNLTYQPVSENPFSLYLNYGGVLGINSTVLLQFSVIGVAVAGVGEGIASNTGIYSHLDLSNLPRSLSEINYSAHESMQSLDFLINVKQLKTRKLSSPAYIKNSYLSSLLELRK